MLKFSSLLSILSVLLLASCGSKPIVEIGGEVPSLGTQELTVVYTVGNGDRAVLKVPAVNGKFEFAAQCADTTDIEIFTANKQLFVAFGTTRGEKLEMSAYADSLVIDGHKLLREFPAEEIADYPEFPALELLVDIDSTTLLPPQGIWVFTSSQAERTDAVMDTLRKNTDNVREVYVSADWRTWRTICRDDSAKWTHALMPDAPLRLKGILTATPCLIEVDSAARILRHIPL